MYEFIIAYRVKEFNCKIDFVVIEKEYTSKENMKKDFALYTNYKWMSYFHDIE